jgi:hypothetical protein
MMFVFFFHVRSDKKKCVWNIKTNHLHKMAGSKKSAKRSGKKLAVKEDKLRTFLVYDDKLIQTDHKFRNKQPGQAAKKAATRGYKKFYLREAGTKKYIEYLGSVEWEKPKKDNVPPMFLNDRGEFKKSRAKRIGIHEK